MSYDKIVYVLENRGHKYIYHWFIFMISGLIEIEDLPKPVYFHFLYDEQFQKETFDLLEPEYKYISDISGYTQKTLYGAPLLTSDSVEMKYYHFLRQIILEKNNLELNIKPFRKIYISRSKSHELNCNNGQMKRQLVNEIEIFPKLRDLGFEILYLENYSVKDKIKIFQEASHIVTPNGGALTFALFANKQTKIIEIHDNTTSQEDQYKNICDNLNLSIQRYTNIYSVDKFGNTVTPGLSQEYNLVLKDIQDFSNYINVFCSS
jgi:capsular polysaccharide biosynthesis protein